MKLKKIIADQRKFVAARNWEPFHTPKNLAAALSVEASELLEIFQWLAPGQDHPSAMDAEGREHLREEIADVFYYLVRLADVTGVDLEKAYWDKMRKNARKYPARLARGRAVKYNRLEKPKRRR